MSRVILFECSPRRPSDGVVVPVRLAWKSPGPANHLGQQWEPVVESPPQFVSAIGFDGREFGAAPLPQVGELSFALTDRTRAAAGLVWKNAAVVIRSAPWPVGGGNPLAGAFSVLTTGFADSITAAGGLARVALVDAGQVLRAPVLTAKFGSTGIAMLDSADAVRDRPADALVPAAWGRPLSVPGSLIDRSAGIWLFSGRAATAVTAFYDGGAAFTLGVARASLAALIANTPASGAVDYCLDASGCFIARPWSAPTFPFTVDATFGAVRAADIASAIVSARGGPAFTAGTVAAFNTLHGADCGLYLDDDTSIDKALDRIFTGLGAFWRLRSAGTIDLRRVGFATPALTVAAHLRGAPERQRIIVPTGRRSLGYARNNKVHSEGDIAAIVQFEDLGGAGKPEANATTADNLQINSRLDVDLAGYVVAGFSWSRAAGINGPPQPWVFQTASGSSGGGTQFIGPRSSFKGGSKLYIKVGVMRTGALSTLQLSANQFVALTGAGIGPLGGARQIVPSVANQWQFFEIEAVASLDAGFMEVTFEGMTGNTGMVQAYIDRISYTAPGADVTAQVVPSLSVPPTATINFDYTGAVLASQLPRTLIAVRKRGDVDVSSSTTWSLAGSGFTATISSGGAISLTALSATTTMTVISVRDGVELRADISLNRDVGPPPTSGGGGSGTSASTSALGNASSTSYGSPVGGPMTLKAGSTGTINATCAVDFIASSGSPAGSFGLFVKWQWRIVGGSFADAGSEASESWPCVIVDDGDGNFYREVDGSITCNRTITGLTNGADYEVQLLARTPSGTRTRTLVGTISAVGS